MNTSLFTEMCFIVPYKYLFHINNRVSKMGENDDLRSLIKGGFKELGNKMTEQGEILSELKDDMKNAKKELSDVKETVKTNSTAIKSNKDDISEMKEQIVELVSSDQDLRRRGGRRYIILLQNLNLLLDLELWLYRELDFQAM